MTPLERWRGLVAPLGERLRPIVERLRPIVERLRPLAERVDQLALRERVLVFASGVTLVYVAWQTLLMDPLAARALRAEQQLAATRQRAESAGLAGAEAAADPLVAAVARERALRGRLAALDAELGRAAAGYVAPERMADLLRELLSAQRGLTLVSLRNLPVESLSAASAPTGAAAPAAAPARATGGGGAGVAVPAADDPGPFLHPVEIVLEGDYLSVQQYLRAVEQLPWRMHWRRVDLAAGDYPRNRVRIEIGTLSLSRSWMTV